jgi:cytochrome c-type biogenesis protein CcmH
MRGMTFWIIVPFLSLLAAMFVGLPLLRAVARRDAAGAAQQDRSPTAERQWRSLLWPALGLAAMVTLPAIGLYAFVGRPDLAAAGSSKADAAPAQQQAQNPSPANSMADMIEQLQVKTRQTPKDPEAWQQLGWAFMHVHRPADAAAAYARAVALAPGDMEDRSALAEATIQSGSGKISEQTMGELKKIVAANASDARARFYLALYKDQQGDHAGAVRDWIGLVKSAPPGAEWASEVRRVVEAVAKEQHLDIAGQLPADTGSQAQPESGPNAEQMEAAAGMSPQDREAMIHGMVDRLAAQLKQNPHDADGWVRLMRAQIVLGDRTKALAAYRDARLAFSQQRDQLSTINDAARALGLAGG